MFDSKRILDQLVSSGFAGGMAGGAAGAALVSALSGKKAKKYAGTALKAGGLALIGGVAYKAWQGYRQQQADTQQAPPGAFVPSAEPDQDALSLLLLKAMIAAARADGNIDAQEHQAIMQRIGEMDLADADKAQLFEHFSAPPDVHQLALQAHSDEHAAEVYAASAMLLAAPSPAEQQYLDRLSAALRLDPALRQEIHRTLEAQSVAA